MQQNNMHRSNNTEDSGMSNPGSGWGLDVNEMRQILMQKVDKSEMESLGDIKSNKSDMERVLRDIDIVHRQLIHVMVLLVEHIKVGLMNDFTSE